MASLRYVFDAVASIKRALGGRLPLIGFSGSPFTLACYMIEGRGSDDFATVRTMVAARPDLVDRIVDINARAVSAYLREQVVAGADAVMIFDTWGGMLTAAGYRRHSLRTMRAVLDALAQDPVTRATPTIVFTKGGGGWLDDLAASGASAVGLDWTVDLAAARARIGGRVALQGNLDPLVLLTDRATIEREANAVVDAAGPAPGHIFNLGHGIVPATPPEHVEALVEAVHRRSRRP
jgi:uroporphyrinogen decarboxylase